MFSLDTTTALWHVKHTRSHHHSSYWNRNCAGRVKLPSKILPSQWCHLEMRNVAQLSPFLYPSLHFPVLASLSKTVMAVSSSLFCRQQFFPQVTVFLFLTLISCAVFCLVNQNGQDLAPFLSHCTAACTKWFFTFKQSPLPPAPSPFV